MRVSNDAVHKKIDYCSIECVVSIEGGKVGSTILVTKMKVKKVQMCYVAESNYLHLVC